MDDHSAIAAARLTLAPLADAHASAIHNVMRDVETMRFWNEPTHQSLEKTREMIAGMRRGSARAWALVPHDQRDAIGFIYYLGNPGPPGLGYILSRDYWRRGLMTEAAQEALRYGFERLALDRVELWIDSRNIASQRLAERLSFRRRAVFAQRYPHDAEPHEKIVYGLWASEWREPEAPQRLPPHQAHQISPILSVADVQAAAVFYRDKLGAAIEFLVGSPPTYGGVTFSAWSASGAAIHFSASDGAPIHPSALYVTVGSGVAELEARYRMHGVEIVSPLTSTPWGHREFTAKDLNGHRLYFSAPG